MVEGMETKNPLDPPLYVVCDANGECKGIFTDGDEAGKCADYHGANVSEHFFTLNRFTSPDMVLLQPTRVDTSMAIRDALLEHVQADIREPPSCIPTNIVKESHPQWDNGDIVSVWEALVDNQVVHQITNGEGWYVNPNRPVSPWAP